MNDSIRVLCRVRPSKRPSGFFSPTTDGLSLHFAVPADAERDVTNNAGAAAQYRFNGIFDGGATQEDVFNVVAREAGGPTATGGEPPQWLLRAATGGVAVTPLVLPPPANGASEAGCAAWTVTAAPAAGAAAAAAAAPLPTVLLLPGGAHVFAASPAHWKIALRLSAALGGAPVVMVDYPRAPVHTAAAALRALERVVAAAVAAAPAGGKLLFAGDSSGGGLALALAQHLVATTKKRRAPVDGLLLHCPWVDVAFSGPQPETGDPLKPRSLL